MTTHKIFIGDSRNMGDVADRSVQLIITSPPYWQLKDYGSPNQVGYYDTYEDYINNLNLVWQESYRVLENECRLCINIGDQFARSAYYGRYKVIPIRTEIIKFCETIGFDYLGSIIWQKVTTTNTSGGASIMGSFPYPRNGVIKIDYEFILIFKKYGKANKVSRETKELSALSKEEWNKYFSGHWYFSGEKQEKHLAMFPEELPKRLIKMFSFVGDTVLDPFLGSGTTTLAAKNNNRNSIGYEINIDYLKIIKEKVGFEKKDLLGSYSFDCIIKDNQNEDFTKKINKLPYIFTDPVKLSRIIDPKENSFGSKIDGKQSEPIKYLNVNKIVNANTIILSDGNIFRLLGIKENLAFKEEAKKILASLVKGKKVFVKFDEIYKYKRDNELIGYLYLKDKTFVNIHLLRSHFVDVDDEFDFKYLKKFKSVEQLR